MANWKAYVYSKGKNKDLDAEFTSAAAYGMIRLGEKHLFWRGELRRYAVDLDTIQRIFRRVETFNGKLCCGAQTFLIERLVMVPRDGAEELDVLIGENAAEDARALLQALRDAHPGIAYGKPEA